MYRYEPGWKPSTVRRFMARVGVDDIENLFALREADCRSRDLVDELEMLGELRGRVDAELRERNSVHIRDLAVDGDVIMRELHLAPGPGVGRVLEHLLERVLESPALNRRETLLELAKKDFGVSGQEEE